MQAQSMKPADLSKKYDKIAHWWHEHHQTSDYGISPLKRAISYGSESGEKTALKALDVGCGSGGRMIHLLEQHDYTVTGIDVSAKMLAIAKQQAILTLTQSGEIRIFIGTMTKRRLRLN